MRLSLGVRNSQIFSVYKQCVRIHTQLEFFFWQEYFHANLEDTIFVNQWCCSILDFRSCSHIWLAHSSGIEGHDFELKLKQYLKF